ncbi:MAG: polyprenyl diphosphate synthase [Nanoarchaeota archaeon]
MHLGIILDGNRRFSKRLMKEPWKGHEHGAEKLKKLIDWCPDFNIKELTLYCFSLENFNRPKKEFEYLMDLFKKELLDLKNNSQLDEKKIRVRFIGKRELLDKELQNLMSEIEEKTKSYNNFVVNFAIAYGGRQEIVEAVKKVVYNNEEINEENIQKNLWMPEEPDLIIRTGGEKRTSNFLPWQSTYSEWIFLDALWPEFTKEDLKNSVDEFNNRQRRFGK